MFTGRRKRHDTREALGWQNADGIIAEKGELRDTPIIIPSVARAITFIKSELSHKASIPDLFNTWKASPGLQITVDLKAWQWYRHAKSDVRLQCQSPVPNLAKMPA